MAFDARDHHDIMSTRVSDLPDGPPTLKGGHYYGVVTRREFGPTRWNNESQSLFYHAQVLEPGEDVSEEDLKGIDLHSLRLNPIAYELVPDRIYAVKKLIRSCNINPSLSVDQAIDEVIGQRVLLTITATPAKKRPGDPEDEVPRIFNNISFMVGAPR